MRKHTVHITVALFALLVAAAPSADAHHGHGGGTNIGDPLPGLSAEELAVFNAGRDRFEHEFTAHEGVGPFMNATSCVHCHSQPVAGGSEDGVADNVQNFGVVDQGRFFESHEVGGPVIHRMSLESAGVADRGDCHEAPEQVPVGVPESILSLRHPPPLFGDGLIDAMTDDEILSSMHGHKRVHGVYGAPNWNVEAEGHRPFPGVTLIRPRTVVSGAPRVGRFGWKSQDSSLFFFTSEAMQNEVGMTTPFHDRESHPNGLDTDQLPDECKIADTQANDLHMESSILIMDFMAMLAPPSRGAITHQVHEGEEVFRDIGCEDCHTKEHHTMHDYYAPWPGGTSHRIGALSHKTFQPFSDFLIHDLGDDNGDQRYQGRAASNFFRTTPLWGLRFKTSYLHHGLAQTFDEAVAAHGGEAAGSRDAYFGLSHRDAEAIDAFLGSL